ncbi:MAG TPA: M20 family metallopeptidase [Thermomicrobiales bacterium]|nr:M20 family metallopeptidase [Thermomicrobiales bacterium]
MEKDGTTLDQRIAAAQACLDTSGLLETLAGLVRIPSVFDPARPDGNERDAATLIGGLLDDWALAYRTREVAPNRPNIVVDIAGTRPGPLLIFEGHTDVVTAGDRAAWSIDPFAGEIRDGRLYGRGACDMKGGLAAMLFAAHAVEAAGRDFAGMIRLAILADEEGLMQGAKGFVADGELAGATAAIICEPEGDRVCIAQKGAIRIRVSLTGRMAHGAMPEEGANPIAALGLVISRCRDLERQIQSEHPPHPLLGTFYLTPTVALAGEREQGNVIPSSAELMLDIRTTPSNDHSSIIERVAAVIAAAAGEIAGVTQQIEIVDNRPATETDAKDPIVRAVIAAHEAETGATPSFGGVPGSTDGTIFWAASRLPLVTYGPGITTLPHQADEYVELDEVVRYARTYIAAAHRYFDVMERGSN